ncbi:MAG: protein kinase domain-containing protein [Gemmatimonadota bacterium]
MSPARLGKYEVLRKIASGGMSEVWLCRLSGEAGFEKKVAVKVVHPRLSGDSRFRDRFAREARIAASLSHQNLVQVFDFGRDGDCCYLAMEYLPGWNLGQAAAQARLRGAPVPLPAWRYWLEGVLAGLGYLHSRGIVHCDISPSNILLSRGGAVKIADFGIARGARRAPGGAEAREGKFSYMSPEQAHGEDATYSSDLFSAAVVAAELFLPGRLFEGRSPEEIMDRVRGFDPGRMSAGVFPRDVDGLLRKALAGKREDRYPDADAFVDALRAAVPVPASRIQLSSYWDLLFPVPGSGDEPTVVVEPLPAAKPTLVRERRGRYGTPGTRRVMFGAASALVAFSIGGVLLWHGTGTDDRREHQGPVDVVGLPPPQDSRSGTTGPDGGAFGTTPAAPPVAPERGASRAGSAARPRRRVVEGAIDAAAPKTPRGGIRAPLGAPAGEVRGVSLVTDPPGAAIHVDDEVPLGETPLRLDISPWKGRTITFRKDGYETRAIRADSLADLSEFRMAMERQTGTVEAVQAIPWAKVYDGDRYLGDTPIGTLTMPTGEHRLRFVNEPLGIEREERVVVRPGRNPKIIVYLIRK